MSEANAIRASWGGYIKGLVTATYPKEHYAIALVGISISGSMEELELDSGEEIVKTIGAEPGDNYPSILRIILNYCAF